MKSKAQISQLFQKQRKMGVGALSDQYENTRTTIEFYNGDSMSYRDRIQWQDTVGKKFRGIVEFNKVQPPIDAVVGFMAQNRRQAKYDAHVKDSEEQILYSKNMNAYAGYHRQNANMDQIETEMDLDMLVNGYGASDTEVTYIMGKATTNPNGEITQRRLDPMKTYWDMSARAKNLLDTGFCGYYDDYYLTDALSLFQGSTEEDFETSAEDTPEDEGGFEFNPWGGLYDKIKADSAVEWTERATELVRVYNHQWFEYETFYRAKNPIYDALTPEDAMYFKARLEVIAAENIKPQGPDGIEVDDLFKFDPLSEELTFDEKMKRALVKDFGDLIVPLPFKRKVFYTAVLSGDHIFTAFKSISQQGFSIKFKAYHFNDARKIWVGMVNSMMQPAEYWNRAMTELLFTIKANSKGGVIIENDAVEDISDFEAKIAQTDGVPVVESGAISGNKIMFKAQAALPTGLEGIMQLAQESVTQNSVDPSFVGDLNDKDMSGILYKRRIRQVVSKLGRPFDALTLYSRELGRLLLDLIPVWVQNNQGGAVQVSGSNGFPEFLEISEDAISAEYSVSIQEAPQTPEDKMEQVEMLGVYADRLIASGDFTTAKQILAKGASMLNMDGDIRRDLVNLLAPQQEQQIDPAMVQQLQQQIQQLTQLIQSGEVEKNKSVAELNRARAAREAGVMTAKDQATTVKTLEEAQRVGAENELISQGNYETPTVTI